MKLTHAQIEAGRSTGGAFNLAQLKALGFPLPARGWPKAGWPKQLMEIEVSDVQYAEFLNLRGNKRERAQRATPELFHTEPSRDDHKPMNYFTDSPEAYANALFEGRDLA